MYAKAIEAVECTTNNPVSEKKRFRFLEADGCTYIAKSTLCPKLTKHSGPEIHLPAWLANELVYFEYVRNSDLRVPPLKRLTFSGEPYVGSEFCKTRKEVKNPYRLEELARGSQDNSRQASMALMYDLALLNCDREPSAILEDERW